MVAGEKTLSPRIELRSPDVVMRLARLGAFHQTRLSFMRYQLRYLKNERWHYKRERWSIDKNGEGVAVYRVAKKVDGLEKAYSLVCFAHNIEASQRSDRVIANTWDATFVLYDGVPSEAEIARLARNAPKQEAGRYLASDLVFSRANKSVRLFEHVLERLAVGRQPCQDMLASVGYLMRTTAVYGNGKFGIAERAHLQERKEMRNAFQAEMLTVWLIRAFSIDYVEQMARIAAPTTAVALEREKRRALGIGNATGLGMAPFLVNHPLLLHKWILARETALARVRSYGDTTLKSRQLFLEQTQRAHKACSEWHSIDKRQEVKIRKLCEELSLLEAKLHSDYFKARLADGGYWDSIFRWGEENFSLEGQEMLVTLLLEPQGEIVDDLAASMYEDEETAMVIDGSINLAEMLALIHKNYAWCLHQNYDKLAAAKYFWYVSEEKLEPRLGVRSDELGANLEQPLAIGRDVCSLYLALCEVPKDALNDTLLAEFLLLHPQHRHSARRVQLTAQRPYAEIRDNLIGSDLYPVDILRCKLSFFGATLFDPRSDRWLRINMYQYAPLPDELEEMRATTLDTSMLAATAVDAADDWIYPKLRCQSAR